MKLIYLSESINNLFKIGFDYYIKKDKDIYCEKQYLMMN